MNFKKITRFFLMAALSASVVFASGCGSSSATSISSASSETTSSDEEGTGDVDDADLEEEDEVDSPYGNDFEEYLDANTTDNLLANHERVEVADSTWGLTGEADSSVKTYLSRDLKAFKYDDGYTEFARDNGNTYDGYDPETNTTFRVLFGDDDLRDEQMENFTTTLNTLYGEGVEEMKEDGDNVVFTSYVRSADAIMVSYDDGETEIKDGDLITRVTTFNKDSKELQNMKVTFTADGKDPVTIETLEMTMDGEEYSPDADLLAKLDSTDSHTASVTLNPGEENETTVTATVGKGCVFYPVIDSSYVYYTDKECTKTADEDVWDEEDDDITLYAKYEEDSYADEEFLDESGSLLLDEDDLESWDMELDDSDSGETASDETASESTASDAASSGESGEEVFG